MVRVDSLYGVTLLCIMRLVRVWNVEKYYMDLSLVFNLFRCLFIKLAYVLEQIIIKIDTDNPM